MNLDFIQSRLGRVFGLIGAAGLSLFTALDTAQAALHPQVPLIFVLALLTACLFSILLGGFIWRTRGRELRYHPVALPAATVVFAAFGVIALAYLGVALSLPWLLALELLGVLGLLALHLLLVPEGSGLAV
ncbi:hypothetical protein Dxin01_00801 [Deinococcus xinjiangensis]|uniref:Uncharacterized protein n=1 Tax=Deinococcus xinjiangensis TaxID=457454 RepID=A0ABP9V962_9DEIO